MIEVIGVVIIIVLLAWYFDRYINHNLYMASTKPCPTCNGCGRINQIDTWAGTTNGDPCPTCKEEGRIPL